MGSVIEDEDRSRSRDAGPLDVTAPSMRRRGGDAIRAAIKRSMDVVVAALAIVVLSPLFLAIALLVVLDSPGPVF